jgi:hypothetical protein
MTLLFKISTTETGDFYLPGAPFFFASILLLVIIYPLLKSMKSLERNPELKEKLI